MQHALTTLRSSRAGARARWVDLAWLAVCALGFLALCWLNRRFVTDDAYITARYAENLAEGHGFVFNPGGPRTEGFSNPLLVGVEAALHPLGVSAIATARAVGIGSGLALLFVLHRLGPGVVGRPATRVALGVTAFYPPMAFWAVGGLETMPVALALTTGVLLLARRAEGHATAVRAGLALAVLPWLRPEGLLVVLAAVGVAEGVSVLTGRGGGRKAALVRVAAAAGIPIASQVVLEAIRLIVYGHWMPNSVVYKGDSAAGEYDVLLRFLGQSLPILLVAIVGLTLCRGRQAVLAVPPVVYMIGSVGVLDSVNSFSRFLLPVWPQVALLAGVAVAVVARPLGRSGKTLAAAAALGAVLVTLTPQADFRTVRSYAVDYSRCQQTARSDAAAWLRTTTPPGTVYSISDAGLVPARGQRRAVDQLMLNEPLIQETGPVELQLRRDIVYSRQPDFLVLVSRDPKRFRGLYPIDRRIAGDPRFGRYEVAHVSRGESVGCGYHLFVFSRSGPPAWLLAARQARRAH